MTTNLCYTAVCLSSCLCCTYAHVCVYMCVRERGVQRDRDRDTRGHREKPGEDKGRHRETVL